MSTDTTAASADRLSAATLADHGGEHVPLYDRSAPASVVHLGMGAFARAHLGVYADDLLRAGWPATIRAVSLRSPQAAEQLNPQDCLYTVTEREPDRDLPPRVMGSVTSVETGGTSGIDAIAAPTTRLITLTVTEKGYDADPDELLRTTDSNATLSAPAVVALGLDRRRRNGLPAPVVAAMDNVLDNGPLLRRRVLEAARQVAPDLAAWIEAEVRFPTSVVDRMVPATTPTILDEVAHRFGLRDLAAVTTEHHRSWVIADVPGLPPLADVGADVVGDIGPYQRRKLWLLNAPHSALAYGGLLVGCSTIAEATLDARVSPFVSRLVADILEVTDLPPALAATAFAAASMRRFRNPALGHTCIQVGADGSRKLPQRLFPVAAERHRRGLGISRFAAVVAAWAATAGGLVMRAGPLPTPADPAAAELQVAAATGDLRRLAAVAIGDDGDRAVVAAVVAALTTLVEDGPMTLLMQR